MEKKPLLIIYASDIVGLGNRDRLKMLSETWYKKGHEVTLLLPESMTDELKKEHSYLRILTIPYTKAIKKFTYLKGLIAYIPRMFLSGLASIPEDIQVVYSMTGIITEVLPAFAFKVRRPHLRWIALIDNLVYLDNRREQLFLIKLIAYIAFRFSIMMCRKADLILTVSRDVKEGLIKLGISENKIVYTSNGIMLDRVFEVENVEVKHFDGVFLGRLDYSKGVLSLIKMWRKLCDITKMNLKLAVVGKGNYSIETEIKEEIRRNSLQDNVKMFGYLSGRDKYIILKKAKFFVYPSIDESWGIVIMEALACGLPVIVYDLDAYRNIYPDGLIERIPLRDTEQFIAAMVNLVSGKNVKHSLQERVDFARGFNWADIMEKEYADIISRL